MASKKIIHVTKPSINLLSLFRDELKSSWATGILTHNGPKVIQFEKNISSLLNLENVAAVANGTLAIQLALKSLDLKKGEVITSPFSWIASVSAIKAEGFTPVFCDIEEDTFNIDPKKISKHVTKNTVAIMPIHVFGNPCNIDDIKKIAKKYKIKVIYDAAHALGSKYKNKSILGFGDVSATSLHSTKILNTAEGGLCVSKSKRLIEKIKRKRFFGHAKDGNIIEDGINAKMTEVHAALGLVNLKIYKKVLRDRKDKYFIYKKKLQNNEKIYFQAHLYGEPNYSYFPIVFKNVIDLKNVLTALNSINVFPRRYFYPSLNKFNKIFKYKRFPISEKISTKIICLPLYYELDKKIINNISTVILKTLSADN
jgi:dTDP-4-amino-4,6-dideoxygalactose transaminase